MTLRRLITDNFLRRVPNMWSFNELLFSFLFMQIDLEECYWENLKKQLKISLNCQKDKDARFLRWSLEQLWIQLSFSTPKKGKEQTTFFLCYCLVFAWKWFDFTFLRNFNNKSNVYKFSLDMYNKKFIFFSKPEKITSRQNNRILNKGLNLLTHFNIVIFGGTYKSIKNILTFLILFHFSKYIAFYQRMLYFDLLEMKLQTELEEDWSIE